MSRTMRWISLGALSLGLWIYAWSGGVRMQDSFLPRKFVQVAPSVFRSGQIDADLLDDVLRENGIDAIVDLQGPGASVDQLREQQLARELGVDYRCFTLNGRGLGDLCEYGRAVASVAEAVSSGRRVLVHCTAGARRTGGVLAVYELLVRGDACKALEELERFTGPGDQSLVLREFINGNRAALAQELVAQGVLPAVPPQIPELAEAP